MRGRGKTGIQKKTGFPAYRQAGASGLSPRRRGCGMTKISFSDSWRIRMTIIGEFVRSDLVGTARSDLTKNKL